MFKPKYRIIITSKCFPKEKFICLGIQLISIINSIKNILPNHVWYGADVEAVGKGARKYNIKGIQLNVIGNDLQFIEYCSEIEQFIWGIFLCIDNDFSHQNIRGIELETEDKPFRFITCDGILIEIRAFDTTYFAIYSEDRVLIEKISIIFNVEIEEIK